MTHISQKHFYLKCRLRKVKNNFCFCLLICLYDFPSFVYLTISFFIHIFAPMENLSLGKLQKRKGAMHPPSSLMAIGTFFQSSKKSFFP